MSKSLTNGVESMSGLQIVVVPINNKDELAREITDTINELAGRIVSGAFRGPLPIVTGSANTNKVRYVAFLGENEIAQGYLTIKDMDKSEQSTIPLSSAAQYLSWAISYS